MLSIGLGCRPTTEKEWQVKFDIARKHLWYGYLNQAFREADESYREAKDVAPAWSWRFQLLKAQVRLFQSKPKEALSLLEPAVPPNIPPDVRARKDVVEADTLCRLGKAAQAASFLKEADGLVPQDDTPVHSEIELTRGRCGMTSDAANAKEHFTNAVLSARNKDEFIEATALLNLGFLLLNEDHFDESIDMFRQGLRETASPLLREKILGNLGFAHSQMGNWKEAVPYSEQAEELAAGIDNQERDRERWLINLGKAHQALWQLPEAEANYLKTLSITRTQEDRVAAAAVEAACYNNLTHLALSNHDVSTAERYMKEGKSLGIDAERLHFALDEAMVAAAKQQWNDAERLFSALAVQAGADPVLQSTAQRELGEVYWRQSKLESAEQMFRHGIETAETSLIHIKEIEHRMSFLDETRFYDSYIRFLAAQNRTADALAVSERAREQGEMPDPRRKNSWRPVPASEFESRVQGPDHVVLAYWITNDESFLWAITPSKLKLFKLPGHLELHQLIDKYNAEIHGHNEIGDSQAGEKLYQTLIGPAETLVPKGAHVVVIPSKVLCWVTFEALVPREPHPHYWIEDVDVQIASSLAGMANLKSKLAPARPTKQILVLGAPLEASPDFPTLKHAAEEIQRVQSHFSLDDETIISGKSATPDAYRKANVGNYRLIHLDTHGISSDRSPLDSAIILSADGDSSYKLYARDIKDIPLHADLVTISACYGAGTRWYNNEGVVGLGWAFLRAGAHQVMAALWDVDDASSPQLMDDFYRELVQGKSAAEALRDAKLKMLHSSDFHRHPYYWASLQLYTGS